MAHESFSHPIPSYSGTLSWDLPTSSTEWEKLSREDTSWQLPRVLLRDRRISSYSRHPGTDPVAAAPSRCLLQPLPLSRARLPRCPEVRARARARARAGPPPGAGPPSGPSAGRGRGRGGSSPPGTVAAAAEQASLPLAAAGDPAPALAARCHGGAKMAALAYTLGKREINHYFSVRSAKTLALGAVLLLAVCHAASRRYRGEPGPAPREAPLESGGGGGCPAGTRLAWPRGAPPASRHGLCPARAERAGGRGRGAACFIRAGPGARRRRRASDPPLAELRWVAAARGRGRGRPQRFAPALRGRRP